MRKFLFLLALTFQAIPLLFGQVNYKLALAVGSIQKVYLEKTTEGTTFIGIKQSGEKHVEFQIFNSIGSKIHSTSLDSDNGIVDTYSSDSSITVYTVTKKGGFGLNATTIYQTGEKTSKVLIQIPNNQEDIITFCEIDGKPTLITLDREDKVSVRIFSADLLLKTSTFNLKDQILAKQLRNGSLFFSGTEQIPNLYSAREESKIFYDNQLLTFVLDQLKDGAPSTHLYVCNLTTNTGSSYLYNEPIEGFLTPRSYIHNGMLYRYFNKGKEVQIHVHELGNKELSGTYVLNKDSKFPGTKPVFVHKHYSKNRISTKPVDEYKKHSRALTTGHETFFILPLENGGVQINLGSYYKNNNGIAPGGMGAIGILLYAATSTTKALINNGSGIENYLSINFKNHQLNSFTDKHYISSLNRLDAVYNQLLLKHKKLSFFDYCVVGDEYYAVYVPGPKNHFQDDLMPPKKGDVMLHVIPFSSFNLP